LVSPAFIADLHGTSRASGVDDPLLCITADGNHHALLSPDAFLTYYYGTQNSSGITDPIHTVTGIDRAGLVVALENLTVEDLTFRMLQPHEIGAAMAFPGTYIVLGNQREKVKQYGNAVTPPAMEMLMERCVDTLV
jgi:DNA (cytosine-5)-methyltransferase 1